MSNTEVPLASDGPPSSEELVACYMTEARELARVTGHPDFDSLLERFLHYPDFLQARAQLHSPLSPLLEATGGTCIVDMETRSPWVWEALYTAHFAACCDLFSGSALKHGQFTPAALSAMVQDLPWRFHDGDHAQLHDALGKLHTMDALRTMQLLRILGLITRPAPGFRQLGLGAASGVKDRYSLHVMPGLARQKINDETGYRFEIEQEYVDHVAIVDSNPLHRASYEALGKDDRPPALGLNMDTLEGLEYMARGVEQGSLACRNLVTAIRFEHRMIPDTALFLNRLAGSIDEFSDLIITMGSGHTGEDFESRAAKLAEIFNALSRSGCRPVLIKLHNPGKTTRERQASLRYGTGTISTYQILYCRVERKALQHGA